MADSKNDNLEEDNNNNEEDSSNDNLENKKNKKYDDKFKCYNYDDNIMYTMYLKNITGDKVKIEKVKDYYDLFVDMLKMEDKKLHTHEHLWVLGIDEAGYSACVYVVIVGYPNFFSVDPIRLFKTALHHDSVKIIIAQSRPDAKILDVTPTDLDLTNLIYHKAEILGLELVDHIIISNSSIDSKIPFYCSHLENGVIYFVQNDMTYKSYKDIEPEIEKARNEYGADQKAEGELIGYEKGEEDGKKEGLVIGIDKGKDIRNIEIVKEMLKENSSIDFIVKVTGLSEEEINEIKKDMK